MTQKFKLDDKEYEVDNLSDKAKATVKSLQFTNNRLKDLKNMQALLWRSKKSYIEDLKRELLSNKAGFAFDDE